MNYIYIYNKLLISKINKLIEISDKKNTKNKNNICFKCKKEFYKKYKIENLTIYETTIHELIEHNLIDYKLYEKIINYEIKSDNINYNLFNTNELNIIDGLYEEGSNKIYIEKNKNIFTSKENRFSEHYGILYFVKNKLEKVVVELNSRVDKDDSSIYMPQNSQEALKVDYIFHTHPKTPYIGSRISSLILYEFPSISDIIHFIDHHNRGILLGSIIIAPEGIYNIRKNTFNRDKIKLDYDLFVSEIEDVYIDCYHNSMSDYSNLKRMEKVNGFYKIPENIFYENVATNLEFIKRINQALEKYDITIDYYNRIYLNDKWIFPTIYLPCVS
jgi:hypothetical protein